MTSASMLSVAGMTPLMAAAQSGDVSTVKYLLGCGDLMKADEKGRTALHHAAGAGNSSVTNAWITNVLYRQNISHVSMYFQLKLYIQFLVTNINTSLVLIYTGQK